MLTGYWSIDVFIVANLLLFLIVILTFSYRYYKGGGELESKPSE